MSLDFSSLFNADDLGQDHDDCQEWEEFLKSVNRKKYPCTPPLLLPPLCRFVNAKAALQTEPFSVPTGAYDVTPLKRAFLRKVRAQACLDLHGMQRMEAAHSIVQFILSSRRKKLRCILIITGKGRNNAGVLKDVLKSVLMSSELHGLILKLSQAKAQDGGEGAFYVFLRA